MLRQQVVVSHMSSHRWAIWTVPADHCPVVRLWAEETFVPSDPPWTGLRRGPPSRQQPLKETDCEVDQTTVDQSKTRAGGVRGAAIVDRRQKVRCHR